MDKEEKCCLNCRIYWDREKLCEACRWEDENNPSLFYRITRSPEVLAGKLVFYEQDICMNGKVITYWTSNVIQRSYSTREEAVAATIDALNALREREVKDVE